jgi:hypothetical protein
MNSEPQVIFSLSTDECAPFDRFGAPVQRCVMPLVAKVANTFVPVGTGFMIHPSGLMITARHVIAEAQRLAEEEAGQKGATYGLYAMYITDELVDADKFLGGPIPIDQISEDHAIDIAICLLRLPRNKNTGEALYTKSMPLTVRIPRPDEHIVAIGYHGMSIQETRSSEEIACSFQLDTAYSAGNITELYPERRDSVFLKFPVAQGSARFKHGMSGGPVFNESGRVFGIICASLSDERRPFVGYVSMLWPALALTLEAAFPNEQSMQHRLYDLARRQSLEIEGIDQILINGLTISYRG